MATKEIAVISTLIVLNVLLREVNLKVKRPTINHVHAQRISPASIVSYRITYFVKYCI